MLHAHLQHFPVQGRSHGAHARGACPFGSEITRGVQICMQRVATGHTSKSSLSLPVLPLGMPTTTTTLTGISGVFFDHLHASQRSLERDEVKQLRKRPTVNHSIDLARHLDAVTNAEELFDVQDTSMCRNDID